MNDLQTLRYPIGPMPRLAHRLDAAAREEHIEVIEEAPARFESLVTGLTDVELDLPYRPGGWTIRQVIHHVPDSHMNAYIRMKLAATEAAPAIKTYDQARWAELPEAKSGPVQMSLALLDALHRRWAAFLRALPEEQLLKSFVHPEWGEVTIEEALVMYSWHCRHHAAHIANALQKT